MLFHFAGQSRKAAGVARSGSSFEIEEYRGDTNVQDACGAKRNYLVERPE
jgi:hypothetical protein